MGKIITVDFRQDQLVALERDDGIYVAVRPICEAMGLGWGSQWNRIQRDPILSAGVFMTKTPFNHHGQEEVCLKLDLVNGWLFTIDESRVKDEETREKVLVYKRECYAVLFQHFYGKATVRLAPPEAANEDPEQNQATPVRMVTECRQTFGCQAAGQLWFKLGLPIVPAMVDNRQQMLFSYDAVKTAAEPERKAA